MELDAVPIDETVTALEQKIREADASGVPSEENKRLVTAFKVCMLCRIAAVHFSDA
jgi:hypothetical protein